MAARASPTSRARAAARPAPARGARRGGRGQAPARTPEDRPVPLQGSQEEESYEPVRAALRAFGADLGPAEEEKLRAYRQLLATSNPRYSLISPGDVGRIVSRHFVECAAFLRWIPEKEIRVLDFGSGGGLPGIVIQILRPQARVVLLEARRKKVVFLRQAVQRLGLARAAVAGGQAELTAGLAPPFERIIARAVSPLAKLLPLATPMLAPGGRLITPKGSGARAELAGVEGKLAEWGLRVEAHEAQPAPSPGAIIVFRSS